MRDGRGFGFGVSGGAWELQWWRMFTSRIPRESRSFSFLIEIEMPRSLQVVRQRLEVGQSKKSLIPV